MKATFFNGKKMILEKNYPDPDFNETLVRVDLAGICGTDLEILDGYMQYTGILGHEFVGTVKQSNNSELIGKRVVGELMQVVENVTLVLVEWKDIVLLGLYWEF